MVEHDAMVGQLIAKVLGEVVRFAHKAAGPIIKLLPKQITTHPKFSVVFAVLVIILACLAAGLLCDFPLCELSEGGLSAISCNRFQATGLLKA